MPVFLLPCESPTSRPPPPPPPVSCVLPQLLSRIGLARVAFAPYTREQIRVIVKARLEALDAFKAEAIELAAGKVASLSGDIRRALQMCRRAAEIAARRVHHGAGGEASLCGLWSCCGWVPLWLVSSRGGCPCPAVAPIRTQSHTHTHQKPCE